MAHARIIEHGQPVCGLNGRPVVSRDAKEGIITITVPSDQPDGQKSLHMFSPSEAEMLRDQLDFFLSVGPLLKKDLARC